jgi:UDP-2-acetamido-3-amino-2,3-dideoxy-glucuronate N-acetyltransferase
MVKLFTFRNMETYIHESSNIYDSAEIGEGTRIGAFVEIGHKVKIGKNCRIGCGSFIPENVIIEDNVFVGPHTVFTNDKNPPSNGAWRKEPPTLVKEGAAIGANSTLLPNIILGNDCKIGAGSVVTKNVPNNEIWLGVPAQRMHNEKY